VFQPKLLRVIITKPRSVYVLSSVLVGQIQYRSDILLPPGNLVYITVIRCICAANSASDWNILLN
jgi:hypothetical protein